MTIGYRIKGFSFEGAATPVLAEERSNIQLNNIGNNFWDVAVPDFNTRDLITINVRNQSQLNGAKWLLLKKREDTTPRILACDANSQPVIDYRIYRFGYSGAKHEYGISIRNSSGQDIWNLPNAPATGTRFFSFNSPKIHADINNSFISLNGTGIISQGYELDTGDDGYNVFSTVMWTSWGIALEMHSDRVIPHNGIDINPPSYRIDYSIDTIVAPMSGFFIYNK